MQAFTQYWSASTARANSDGRMESTGGSRFHTVQPGDHVYVLSSEGGRVRLVGTLEAAARRDYLLAGTPDSAIFTKEEVARQFGKNPEDYLAVPQWLLAKPGTARDKRFDLFLRADDLRRLRFEGKRPTLALKGARLHPMQQIRTVRCLTSDSAVLLDRLLAKPVSSVKVKTKSLGRTPKRDAQYETTNLERRLEQREDRLVRSYERYLATLREPQQVVQKQFSVADLPHPLSCDMFIEGWNLLIEAKASTSRSSLRMAIGQLADYSRFFERRKPRQAVLLPERPTTELGELLALHDIATIWRAARGHFEDSAGGKFT
jgi:hypothetical protein